MCYLPSWILAAQDFFKTCYAYLLLHINDDLHSTLNEIKFDICLIKIIISINCDTALCYFIG